MAKSKKQRLEDAEKHLEMWEDAERAVANAQSYRINDRQITRADIAQIRENIMYYERKIERLKRSTRNRRRQYVPLR